MLPSGNIFGCHPSVVGRICIFGVQQTTGGASLLGTDQRESSIERLELLRGANAELAWKSGYLLGRRIVPSQFAGAVRLCRTMCCIRKS
jgi:hypothetical protein